jgi:menaquinone-9 beta-reductase
MSGSDYDIVIVGGGLGGSALAKVMAENGKRTLLLEKEMQFRDRVRGEGLVPWGGAEAVQLGCYRLLCDSCAFEKRWLLGSGPDRDLIATTPQKLPFLTFYHPEMQERMLKSAIDAGADVRRGALVRSVVVGVPPRVQFETDAGGVQVEARLVVGADGRGSAVRRWGKFNVTRDVDRLLLAGVLLDDVGRIPDDAFYFAMDPARAQAAILNAQGPGRARAYLGYRVESDFRLRGGESMPRFVEESVQCGIPLELYAKAKMAGPLATFAGADNWVEHPYSNGIALIGDAAATSDPIWGQGMSLTLRDVRVLRDGLLADDDWDKAAHAYATEHDRYYGAVHSREDLLTEFFYGISAEAKARRDRAMPLINEDPSRVPDYVFRGPELPLDEGVKARLFGEA